jgi:hypothetical protein
MKKYLNLSLIYAVFAMAAGVFYREFTKWNGFTGVTALGKVHAHLFLLGMMVFLLVALFSERHALKEQKSFRIFLWLYNIGVPLTAVMLAVRGSPAGSRDTAFGRNGCCCLRYCGNRPYPDRCRTDSAAGFSEKDGRQITKTYGFFPQNVITSTKIVFFS